MSKLTFDNNGFYLDGTPYKIIAGDIHYFRIPRKDWESILDLAIDFGLNTIQTYVPWNAHEPSDSVYNFTEDLDLAAYLEICHQKGLMVLLRPSPYICSEWELGGLPARLLKDRTMNLRTSDPKFLAEVEKYYNHLIPVFLPYLSTKGGPIIAVSVENEYGGYGNDTKYLRLLADMMKDQGVDVPLYTTDSYPDYNLVFGRLDDEGFVGVNYRAIAGESLRAKNELKKIADHTPFFIGEMWAGRSMHWGEPFYHRNPVETATAFKEALELDGNVCFYMFAGGTNFGFMGGGNISRSYSPRPDTPIRYIPHTTSYDVDALIGEGGEPTEKYFLCKEVLDKHLEKTSKVKNWYKKPRQSILISINETADLFENIEQLTEFSCYETIPKPMEDYGQSYGLILYTTIMPAFESSSHPIAPYKYKDRANLYVDDCWFATFMRDRGLTRCIEGASIIEGMPVLKSNGLERKIDILVENTGRINYGREIVDERKGLEDAINCYGAKLMGYETRTLPLNDLSRLVFQNKPHTKHRPCFFRGFFDAKSGIDSFVDFEKFGHGYIWVNGFNLGRYDSAGPQMTLYLPGHLLKESNNEIIILDIDPISSPNEICLIDHKRIVGDASELT